MFAMRTNLPDYGSPFYNNGNAGGASWCINGNPTCSGRNVLSNCVGYACGRFNEIIGSMQYPQLCCNAEYFIEKAKQIGLEISDVPTMGGIIVWKKGSIYSGDDGGGHVAIVEDIYSTYDIYTSESAWGGTAFFNARRTGSNYGLNSSYQYIGCVVNPAVGRVTTGRGGQPGKITEDGLWGVETTKKAQQVFGTPVDGIVSKQVAWVGNQNPGLLSSTFEWLNSMQGGSLLIASIQRKVGVNADGYIGRETISAMQRWLGTPVDGCVSNPSLMVSAFQRWLNEQ